MPRNNKMSFPPLWVRVHSVWYRHYRVYTQNIVSNGLPPFLEPLIFLAGIGLGMGKYVSEMEGIPYLRFLSTGLPITAAMFTAAFECSFGTFIRLEFDKVYDGMLGAPITVHNLLIGEILWAGTKGMFFATAVVLVVLAFGQVPATALVVAPVIGFLTGIMFAGLSLFVTSFVKTINHFNFYFTGFLSPMFFFSGVVFPVGNLPESIRPFAEIFPLTHSVRLMRRCSLGNFSPILGWDVAFIVIFTVIAGHFAIRRLSRRLIG
ncbi:MAG: ABC transporter [Chitinivibrionales bacterium]|nr:ABC transporter [Chitinivibrionales bacterium]MBD3356956.1 ABC transporter [Chitinivibrionales bacterium]